MISNQTAKEIRRVAQSLDDAVERQDVETAVSCFSDTAEIEVFGLTFKGPTEIKQVIAWMYQRFGRIKFQPIVITVEGSVFFEEFTLHAKFNGKEININAAEVLVYENYKITRLKLFLDRLEMAQAASTGFIEGKIISWINQEIIKDIPQNRHV